jgi:hypothetical protein
MAYQGEEKYPRIARTLLLHKIIPFYLLIRKCMQATGNKGSLLNVFSPNKEMFSISIVGKKTTRQTGRIAAL